jgi:hypothetical protein
MSPKIDVMEREWKNFNFWSASKQGLSQHTPLDDEIQQVEQADFRQDKTYL